MGWKKCGACGIRKDAAEFHKRTASVDGLAARCKACQREYDKRRLHKESRVDGRKAYQATAAYRKSHAASAKRWYERNPEKRRAHIYLNNALRSGKITRAPCEKCGSLKSQAHHEDYTKPLDVRWLCDTHHKQHHHS